MINLFKKKKTIVQKVLVPEIEAIQKFDDEQEIAAAIALALNLHLQKIHDYENMILTIQKVVRPYSPWSSKIYSLRQYPRR